MPKLIVVERAAHRENVYRLKQDQISIGRHEDNDIVLGSSSISRHHAEILYDRRDYYLVDLDSGNGTHLNGRPIHPNERNLLRTNDIITIAPYEIHFMLGGDDDREPSHFDEEIADTDIIEIKMIKKMLASLESDMAPSLQIASGPSEGKSVTFTESMPECTIGRDENCGLMIPDPSVSRVHAVIERKWGGIAITDLDSKNGSFVNGERIKEKLLKDGDQVVIGTIKVLYRNPQDVNISAIEREYARNTPDAAAPSGKDTPTPPSSSESQTEPAQTAAQSAAAQATASPDTPPSDDDLPDLFGADDAPKPADTPPAPAQPPSSQTATDPNEHLLWYALIAIGAVIFLAAFIGMVWLLVR